MRASRLLLLLTFLSLAGFTVYTLRPHPRPSYPPRPSSRPVVDVKLLAINASAPLQLSSDHVHPIQQLVLDAQDSWSATLQSQSGSLKDAVAEYERRYGLPPPPHFDRWYAFAKRKGVQLIDEYDTIYHSLLPFWAVSPLTLRERTREALGYQNYLMALSIRDGKVAFVDNGQDWLMEAIQGMMQPFVQYLPDMDLAFNTHDEPRVVVPHDELSKLVHLALTETIPNISTGGALSKSFSGRPKDVYSTPRIPEVKTTRFNMYAHQPTWVSSKMSCSLDSPARALDDSHPLDNLTTYALGDLGFIYNQTAFSDVCNSPSLSRSHGFFDRPNAFNIIHELFPIFSQSKMSNFQDILYPSPWYWFGKVTYDEEKDIDWKDKLNKLWWRGSTTGGYSRDGGWKRQHRQQFVRKMNGLDTAKILYHSTAAATDEDPTPHWIIKDVQRQEFEEIMDVHFSHIGQCDETDCDAQREFFKIVEPADQQDAWQYRYLLDMDGNAFSGRFYAFLTSHSLTFKMAVFREWHEEWIKPWLHYVPLSLRGEEALEAVRYFDAEEEGRPEGIRIAEGGREWAKKALRNEDLEVWLFRLLLE